MHEQVGEPADVQGWELLHSGLNQWQSVQRRLLLPCGVQEYDAVPCGVSLRVLQHVKPDYMRCGELLSVRRIK